MEHLSEGSFKLYQPNYEQYKEDENFWKDFDYKKYLTHFEKEKEAIISYGHSRSISSGYHCGVYFTRDFGKGTWIRHPSLMFLHEDKDGNIIGAKFRQIPNANGTYNGPRFSMRGKPGFYVLHSETPKTFRRVEGWLCESETSTNSLWSYFKDNSRPATVVCCGGVSSPPKELPNCLKDKEVRLIIDYDGDEDLYQERLKLYAHLDVTPVRIILPKGEDINSLYHKKEIWKIERMLQHP